METPDEPMAARDERSLARLAVIILAAGRSERMGSRNKLLLPVGDLTIIERSVEAAVRSRIGEVIVVLGSDSEKVADVLADRSVRLVFNAAHAEGMASSIRAGVLAGGPACAGYAVCPGDMPAIRSSTYDTLARTLESNPNNIIVPVFEGRSGHPVLFGRKFYDSLAKLRGDGGARSVVEGGRQSVIRISIEDPGILRDVDTEEDWRQINASEARFER